MSDNNTDSRVGIGEIKTAAVAGAVLVSVAAGLYFWARKRNSLPWNGRGSRHDKTGNNAQPIESAIKSHIETINQLLREAGIADSDTDRYEATSAHSWQATTLIDDESGYTSDAESSGVNESDGEKSNQKVNRIAGETRLPRNNMPEVLNEMLSEIHKEMDEELLTNEGIAEIVLRMIRLKNMIDPDEQVDVRNIYFMNDGKQENMVIDLYTAVFDSPAYDEELSRLWREVFLAEDFWNADFTKVRINVKESETDNALETVACSLEDVRRYLLQEIEEERFASCCKHRRAKSRKSRAS